MTLSERAESRFTPSRPDCLHPDHWHSNDADSAEFEVTELVAAFVRALQPEFVIETGTAWGQTAEAIGKALKANGHGELVTLDVDHDRVRFSDMRCIGLPVICLEIPSLNYVPVDRVDIGFAWFDSLVPLRSKEFMHFYKWMTPGKTIVGFHDTGPQHGLKPSIEELRRSGLLTPIYLPTPRGVGFAQVL